MNKFTLAITGPTGSGKSTVAIKLAKQFNRCVEIEIDDIKHFIVTTSSYETTVANVKKWNYDEWELVGDSVGLLAENFLAKGYNVIINGYMEKIGWMATSKHINLDHKILLLPDLREAMKRDQQRLGDKPMGRQAVKDHYEYLSTDSFFDSFTVIDTTNHSVDQTVAKVKVYIK